MRLELLRAKSPEWKLAKTLEMIEFSIQTFPEQTRRAIRATLRNSGRFFQNDK